MTTEGGTAMPTRAPAPALHRLRVRLPAALAATVLAAAAGPMSGCQGFSLPGPAAPSPGASAAGASGASPTPGATASPQPTPSPSATASADPGATASPQPTPSPSATASADPGASPEPTATPTVEPSGGQVDLVQNLPLDTLEERALLTNQAVEDVLASLPDTGNAQADAVLEALGDTTQVSGPLIRQAIGEIDDSSFESRTLPETPLIEAIKGAVPVPVDQGPVDIGSVLAEGFPEDITTTEIERLDIGTYDEPITFTGEDLYAITGVPASASVGVFGYIQRLSGLSPRTFEFSFNVKGGSKVEVGFPGLPPAQTLEFPDDTSLGWFTIALKQGQQYAYCGFLEPFTRSGYLYLIYSLSKTDAGGAIDVSMWWSAPAWTYDPETGTYGPASDSDAAEFEAKVGNIAAAQLRVDYTRATRKIKGTVSNVKDFDGNDLLAGGTAESPAVPLNGAVADLLEAGIDEISQN